MHQILGHLCDTGSLEELLQSAGLSAAPMRRRMMAKTSCRANNPVSVMVNYMLRNSLVCNMLRILTELASELN